MKSKKELIEELNHVVWQTSVLTTLYTHSIARKIGLSSSEFEALDLIRNNQPLSAGNLAVYCGLTTGAITGVVDRLEHAGLVCRKTDPADRRRVLLQPVDKANVERDICALYEPLSRAFNTVVASYSQEQLQFLVQSHSMLNKEVEKIIAEF